MGIEVTKFWEIESNKKNYIPHIFRTQDILKAIGLDMNKLKALHKRKDPLKIVENTMQGGIQDTKYLKKMDLKK